MKVSEVSVNDIVEYLKLNDGEYEESDINTLIIASKSFIKSFTGLSDEEIDTHEDITIVLYILCQDFHYNRNYYTEKTNLNRVVQTILNMHRKNFFKSVVIEQ